MEKSELLRIGKSRFAEFQRKKQQPGLSSHQSGLSSQLSGLSSQHSNGNIPQRELNKESINGIDVDQGVLKQQVPAQERDSAEAQTSQSSKGSVREVVEQPANKFVDRLSNELVSSSTDGLGKEPEVETANSLEKTNEASTPEIQKHEDNSALLHKLEQLRQDNQKLENLNSNLSNQLLNQGDELAVLREDNTRLIQEFDSVLHDDQYSARAIQPQNEVSLSVLAGCVQERCQQLKELLMSNGRMSKESVELLETIQNPQAVRDGNSTTEAVKEVIGILSRNQNLHGKIADHVSKLEELVDPVNVALGATDVGRFSGINSSQMKKVAEENEKYVEIIDSEKRRNGKLINQIIALQRHVQEVEQEKQVHVSSLKQLLNNLALERSALDKELQNSNEAIHHYRKLATESADECVKFQNRLNERTLEVESLQHDLNDLQERLRAGNIPIESPRSNDQHSFDKLVERMTEVDAQKRDLEQKNEHLQLERDILSTKFDKLKYYTPSTPDSKEDSASEPNANGMDEHESLLTELEVTRQKVKQLSDDKYYLAEQVDSSFVDIETLSRNVAELEDELQRRPATSMNELNSIKDNQSHTTGSATTFTESKEAAKPALILPHLAYLRRTGKTFTERRSPAGIGSNLKPALHTTSAWTSFMSFIFASWMEDRSRSNVIYHV